MSTLPHDNLNPHQTVPPEACYWAEMDVGVLPRRHRADPQRLGFLFENELPCAIDELHAVYQRTTLDRVIGCAMARSRLEEMLVEQPSALLSLTPATLPEFISGESLEPRRFNLLAGAYEPISVRRKRRQWLLSMVFLTAALGILLTTGLERRRAAADRATTTVRANTSALIAAAIGPTAGPLSLPPEQRLVSTLRLLEQTRSIDPRSSGNDEAELVQVFLDLLSAWPAELHAETELISITPESISIRGRLPKSADVQSLADSLDHVEGWAVRQPQVSTARNGVQAMLTLARTEREERSQ